MPSTALCLESDAGSMAVRFSVPYRMLGVWFHRARSRARDRAALALLTDRDFRDIGTNRSEVVYELAKPFWRG